MSSLTSYLSTFNRDISEKHYAEREEDDSVKISPDKQIERRLSAYDIYSITCAPRSERETPIH
ncbi:hypothetical protein BDN70DRAFT_884197 [Pholiota conissans]|uniref:Uncharacterized protein n=1 Tax=Pholiota conissans TaxID=109636 RepID=A0A9P6CWX3_9AGAR|nr:hypothetical protein BDN70DRAFT_884197 [Pholiota conissans]